MSLYEKCICFIGAGSMAEAVVRGLIGERRVQPGLITVTNRANLARLDELGNAYGVRAARDEASRLQAVAEADIVVLAMKPKDVAAAVAALKPAFHPGQLIVSVIAGLSIETIAAMLLPDMPVVRTMPNTSSMIGLGATGISYSVDVTVRQRELAREMFESIGVVCEVEEQLLDIVTGVSGSGPAYIYYVMEAMIAGGVRGGLDEATARALTLQTVRGAAEMVRQTGEEPAVLRAKVTSPNGTTQAALELMTAAGVDRSIAGAVTRAAERAGELGTEIAASLAGNKPASQ